MNKLTARELSELGFTEGQDDQWSWAKNGFSIHLQPDHDAHRVNFCAGEELLFSSIEPVETDDGLSQGAQTLIRTLDTISEKMEFKKGSKEEKKDDALFSKENRKFYIQLSRFPVGEGPICRYIARSRYLLEDDNRTSNVVTRSNDLAVSMIALEDHISELNSSFAPEPAL